MKKQYFGFLNENIFSRNIISNIMIEQMKKAEHTNPFNLLYYGFYPLCSSKLVYVNKYDESEAK